MKPTVAWLLARRRTRRASENFASGATDMTANSKGRVNDTVVLGLKLHSDGRS
jgi:hypothetical protein